jgi:O-antigen ligase
MVLHIPIAKNNYWAFWTTYSQVGYLLLFLCIIAFVTNSKRLIFFIDLWILINVSCALLGIIHNGLVPHHAFMGDENDFALVMTMAIPFAYFMFLETNSIKKKIFYLAACGLFIGATVVSFSRGGLIGLVPVAAYCWYKSPKKLLASVLIGFMLIIFLSFTTERYWTEVKTIFTEETHEDGTGAQRRYYWKCAWRMFLDHPIIGVGPSNFPWNIEKYERIVGIRDQRLHGGTVAHSLYFTLLSELGLVGILLFCGMLYFFQKDKKWIISKEKEYFLKSTKKNIQLSVEDKEIIQQLKKIKFVSFAITGALIGYLISGAFLSVLYYPHFWLIIAALSLAHKNIVAQIVESGEIHIE